MLLDVPAPLAASLRDKLDGLIFSEDVQVTDESARLSVWTVIRRDELHRHHRRNAAGRFASLTEVRSRHL